MNEYQKIANKASAVYEMVDYRMISQLIGWLFKKKNGEEEQGFGNEEDDEWCSSL